MRRYPSLLLLSALVIAAAGVVVWRSLRKQPTTERVHNLDGLSHVVSVEGEPCGPGELTVVHLRDWHHVPRALFEQDVQAQAGKALSKDELDRLYVEHLDDVEKVQKQLEAVIRELAKRNPDVLVFVEGLTDGGVNVYRLKATALSDAGKTQIAEAKKSLAEVREMTSPKAADLAKEYEALIAKHRAEWLEMGATAGPCVEELIEVRALDDAEALKAAEPRWLGGELFDPEAYRARQEAMARRLAQAEEALVVVLLGGKHDLTEALKRHATKARYVRVTVKAYSDVAGEK